MVAQQDAHSPSPHTALLLHRLGLDCGLEAQNPGFNCTTTQGQLSISGLFRGLDVHLLQPMSLSLMHSQPPLSNDSYVNLEPMEVSAYKLKLC